jgi:4-diphosphocytidyl-2-C-methyl-D-erythritol kinase
MTELKIQAPAKINLYLRIVGRRPDGLHDIETVFQKIDLCDDLRLLPSERDELAVIDSPWPIGPDEENLALRALRLMRQEAGGDHPPLRIELTKRIPPGAGLGGGSSDAAAVLRGLNSLWKLDLCADSLSRMGRQLGADVPFLVSEAPCAIGRGIGDILEPVVHSNQWPCTLIYPGYPSSTAEAYRELSLMHPTSAPSVERLIEALMCGDRDSLAKAVHSDFAPFLLNRYPEVREAMTLLRSHGLHPVWPTGSGSAVVGVGEFPTELIIPERSRLFRIFAASLLRS